MDRREAKLAAIEIAEQHYGNYAVIYRDGDGWGAGWHSEARYLESFFDSEEIHICNRYETRHEWRVYKSSSVKVDYIKETGATGKLADMLRAMMDSDD